MELSFFKSSLYLFPGLFLHVLHQNFPTISLIVLHYEDTENLCKFLLTHIPIKSYCTILTPTATHTPPTTTSYHTQQLITSHYNHQILYGAPLPSKTSNNNQQNNHYYHQIIHNGQLQLSNHPQEPTTTPENLTMTQNQQLSQLPYSTATTHCQSKNLNYWLPS